MPASLITALLSPNLVSGFHPEFPGGHYLMNQYTSIPGEFIQLMKESFLDPEQK
jgi:hypothetical protein